MMKQMTAILILLNIFLGASAQDNKSIKGTISQPDGKPAEAATVNLLRANDTATFKLAVTDDKGNFRIEGIPAGGYFISVTAAGFKESVSVPFTISTQSVFQVTDIVLSTNGNKLNEVTITARRPLIEQKIDRTIIHVDASLMNAGTSALEVLEKSPGVSVDNNGRISLKGKEGVLILIDGRPTQLSGEDLANMLRGMNSSQLDQVEIMTNPPAKYDAAGNSGIINIKTKKSLTRGYNGTASAAYGHGQYPKTNSAFNFNYRTNKINLYSSLSHGYRRSYSILKIQRNIRDEGTMEVENYFDQRADMNLDMNSFNGKLGLDYFAGKKTTLGVVLNGRKNEMTSLNNNSNRIYTSGKDLEGITRATVENDRSFNNIGLNLNFRHVPAKGRELSSDMDYLNYNSTTDQMMVNNYENASGNLLGEPDSLRGDLPQQIRIYSGRLDYLHGLGKNSRFEAGIKSGYVETDNDARYDSIQSGLAIPDLNRSNHFVYREYVHATYVNFSAPLTKKINAQIGLRLEHTQAKGKQHTTGETFSRGYTQLFPTAYFQYKANDRNQFGASFGRRIQRPGYGSLNPFIRFIDRYTYSQGTPGLKPSISNNVELSHSWRNRITTTINYSNTTDMIEDVIEQKGLEAYKAPANIASLRQFGIAVSLNMPMNSWWMNSIHINAFNNRFRGMAGGADIELKTNSFIITGTQQFKLGKYYKAEFNGRFRNGWLEGITRAKAVGFIGAGISRQLMQGKGTLQISVRDILHSQKFRAESRYGNVDFNFQQEAETRVVTVGFIYRFNKGKKIAPVKHTKGSAGEEQERIGE